MPQPTWYLLVELKGISATLGFLSRIFLTEPQESWMHLSRADSEASPAVSRCRGERGHQCKAKADWWGEGMRGASGVMANGRAAMTMANGWGWVVEP